MIESKKVQPTLGKWRPPNETGDWAEDNRIGRKMATDFLLATAAEEIPLILPRIFEDMGRQGRYEGIETGFLYELSAEIARAKAAPILAIAA